MRSVVYNSPVFTLELWIRLSPAFAAPSVVVSSAYLPDRVSDVSNGYLVLIDPCGNLTAWVGVGRSTRDFEAGARLTQSLLKTCSDYVADVTSPLFPWLVVRAGISASQWHYVAVAFSSTVRILTLTVDGVTVQHVATSLQLTPNEFAPLTLGGSLESELQVQAIPGDVASLHGAALWACS
jgi:hypothetical protein